MSRSNFNPSAVLRHGVVLKSRGSFGSQVSLHGIAWRGRRNDDSVLDLRDGSR